MTGSDPRPDGHRQDEILAGEYVLGVLSIEDRRMVERRMADDAVFSQTVERWQTDMAPFNQDYDEVTPRAAVLEQLEHRLFAAPQAGQATVGNWNSMAFWRWLSLGTSVAAIAALVYASGIVSPSPRDGTLVAELSAPSNAVNMLASYDAASGRMRIVPVAAGRAQEKSLELWLVPGQGDPYSLGILPADTGGELVIPADMRGRIGVGATLAVTLEPFGGSPTGRPTGAIVASGTARSL
ncbi:Anti-sigma-K factor rskA [compost metagenome]